MSTIPGTAGRLAALYGLQAEPLYGPAGAPVYDVISQRDPAEIGDVLRLAQGIVGPVLELACGSGRLTLPLAARGHDIVALDNSSALLGLLSVRLLSARLLDDHSGTRLVEADMASFELDESFAFILLGASSVCLLDATQRASTFNRAREHLAPDGVFYLSVLDLADTLVGGVRPVERTRVAVDGRSVITLFQHFDGRRRVRMTSLLHESVDDGITTSRTMYTSEINIVSSTELAGELSAAGFEIIGCRRGPDGEQVQVQLICRLAGGTNG
ncbi:MAG: daptide-type RiPP biosynthesis methyltransferase [Pseudonocardiaceae bacterium]